jgi:hypothetical protein
MATKTTRRTTKKVNTATVKPEKVGYKYDAKFHDPWVFSLALKGATDEEIAAAMGVSRMTIDRWSTVTKDGEKVLTSFGEKRRAGKEQADALVVAKLYERCIGYEVEEEVKTIDVSREGTTKIGTIKTTTKHIAPDTLAIMYWLNNRTRKTGEWSQKQDVNVSFDDKEKVVFILPEIEE